MLYRTVPKTGDRGVNYIDTALCAHCRDCVEKCPQDLEVPELLEPVVAEFQGDGLREREAMVRGLFAR